MARLTREINVLLGEYEISYAEWSYSEHHVDNCDNELDKEEWEHESDYHEQECYRISNELQKLGFTERQFIDRGIETY